MQDHFDGYSQVFETWWNPLWKRLRHEPAWYLHNPQIPHLTVIVDTETDQEHQVVLELLQQQGTSGQFVEPVRY